MALPSRADLLTLAYVAAGRPLVVVAAKASINSFGEGYYSEGVPFTVANLDAGGPPPDPPASGALYLMVVIT